MKEELKRILEEANLLKEKIKSADELENFRIKFLGRKGILREYLKKITDLPDEEKKSIGKYLNHIKNELEKIISDLQSKVKKEKTTQFDFRHPGKRPLIGHLHPINLALQKIEKIFTGIGFSMVDSPEIVTEYENFDSLNMPKNHPARDMQDTLWISQKSPSRSRRAEAEKIQNSKSSYLFRTQTSSHQVAYMQNNKLPFRIIVPGKAFRHDASDRTHDFEFNQLEGLAIGNGADLSELKGVLEYFFSQFFGKKLTTRFRTGYFPFVEPGLEVDLECIFCNRKGCRTCKNTGFIEVAGAGMVHPCVLKEGGLDIKENYGYAFGFGLDRMVMLKYQIDDIRLLHSSDLRFIKQF